MEALYTTDVKIGTKHERSLVCPECLQVYTPEMRTQYRKLIESGGDEDSFFKSIATSGYLSPNYWAGYSYEDIKNTDLKDCCKEAFRKDPDLATLHPRYGTQSFTNDPSVTYLPFVMCSGCDSRKISSLTEKFEQEVAREGLDPEVFFNKYRVRKCCRKFITAPHVIPLGKSFYNENLISGTPIETIASSTGKYYYDTASQNVQALKENPIEPIIVDIVKSEGSSKKEDSARALLNILEVKSGAEVQQGSFFRNVSNPIVRPEVKSIRKNIFAKDFDFETESAAEKTIEEKSQELFFQQFPGGDVTPKPVLPKEIVPPTPSFMSTPSSVPQKSFSWLQAPTSTPSPNVQWGAQPIPGQLAPTPSPSPSPWGQPSVQPTPVPSPSPSPWGAQQTPSPSPSPWGAQQTPVPSLSPSPWSAQPTIQPGVQPTPISSSGPSNYWEKVTGAYNPSTNPPSTPSSSATSLPVIELKTNAPETMQIPENLRIPDRNDPVMVQRIRDFLRSSKKREPTQEEVQVEINQYINRMSKKQKEYLEKKIMSKDKGKHELAFSGVYKVRPDEFQRDKFGNIVYHEANPDYVEGNKSTPSYKVAKLVGIYQAR